MKRFVNILIIFSSLIACGKEPETKPYQPVANLCDPLYRPDLCSQSLLANGKFSRSFEIGEDGEGIEITRPDDTKMKNFCESSRLNFLRKTLPQDSITDEGLFRNEFISSTGFKVRSTGSKCIAKNVFKKCTKKINFARISCQFEVFSF